MRYICMDCHNEFEVPVKEYDHGTGHMDDICPICGSEEFEEAADCEECGKTQWVDSLTNGLCAECISKAADDFDTVVEYGNEYKDSVELNGFFAWAFTPAQIEKILLQNLMMNGDPKKDAKQFALDDTYEFSAWLKRRNV